MSIARLLVLAAVLFALPSLALADKLHLKDGSVLNGTIVSQQNGVIVFESSMGRAEIAQEKVDRVEYGAGSGTTSVATPVPTPASVWDPAAASSGSAAPGLSAPVGPTGGMIVIPKIGYHQYSGPGWSGMVGEKHDFDGPTLEIAVGTTVHSAPGVEMQVFGMSGWYGGSTSECDSAGSERACVDIALTNFFAHGAGRIHVPASQLFFFGQIGAGFHHSSFDVKLRYTDSDFPEDNFTDSISDSRTTASFHALIGAGVKTSEKVSVLFEARFLSANGKFPDATESLDMGGNTFLVGAAFRL